MRADTLIIGGGLSGLYLAYRLARENHPFVLVEARDRLGGRIFSPTAPGDVPVHFDLGPAWVWPALQPMLRQLLVELDLGLFVQYTQGSMLHEDTQDAAPQKIHPPSAHGQSYRLSGGAGHLVERLAAALPATSLRLNQKVVRLIRQASTVEVELLGYQGVRSTLNAGQVVLALPPRLLARSVQWEPAMPAPLRDAWINTPTWMAGQAKLAALYTTPFWRDQGLSGEAYSRRGPLAEIHDASPEKGGPHALFGFVGIPAVGRRQLGEAALRQGCLAQLRRLFGAAAGQPLAMFIKDWSEDTLTATEDDLLAPAHHPAYGTPAGGRTRWDGQLIWAGSESAENSGGYLEGALEAAEAAHSAILRGARRAHRGTNDADRY